MQVHEVSDFIINGALKARFEDFGEIKDLIFFDTEDCEM